MTKGEALKYLSEGDHAFLSEKRVKQIADAFGIKITTYLAKANPQDFKGLSLWNDKGEPISEARGQDAHKVALQICATLKLKYQDMFGIGSQLRSCCESIAKYLHNEKV